MSCSQCELKRAKLLIETRLKMDQFDRTEIMKEFELRWPGRFYIDMGFECMGKETVLKWFTIMQRNTVAPYTPKEVYHYVNSTRNA